MEGAEAVGEASGLLDDEVDGLGSAVGDAVGLEPGQDMLAAHPESSAQTSDFGDRAVVERADDMLGDRLALGGRRGLVHRSQQGSRRHLRSLATGPCITRANIVTFLRSRCPSSPCDAAAGGSAGPEWEMKSR
jgi:hypothetical protein